MNAGKGCRQEDGKVRDAEGGASALLLATPTPSNQKAPGREPQPASTGHWSLPSG